MRASSRVIGVVMAAAVAVALLAPAAVAVGEPPLLAQIQINGGSASTNSTVVTVSTPATNAVSMRLSNDGITWKSMPWAPSTTWNVIDPAYGGTSAIGRKTVYAEVDDGSDTWSPDWGFGIDDIFFDNQAPVESQMRVSFEPNRQVTSAGLVTMRITWFNDDHAQSGTQTYDIEKRADGGAWTAIPTHPPLPGLFSAFGTGHTYQLRVRGHDYAGNISGWYEGPAFRATAYQEPSGKFTWTGRWAAGSSASYWGGHAKSSQTVGSKAKISVTGRMIALVARVGPTRGYVVVLVNGTPVAQVSLRASTAVYRRVVWSKWYPTSATRTVTFRVLSVPGPDWVDIDAVLSGS